MADDPIRIGTAALGILIAESGSHIVTDESGVQHGTIRHWIGNQSLAQTNRFALGATYAGTLPQFSGFFVEKSGDILGNEGQTAFLDVQYARIDPLWINIPKRTHDLQLVNLGVSETSGYGALYSTLFQVVVPIPHPILTYKFATATYPSNLGTYSFNPPNAPAIPDFVYHLQQFDFTSGNLEIDQKTIQGHGTVVTINIASGTCTRAPTNFSSTITGIFSQNNLGTVNPLNLNFTADPQGWFCLKEDVTPTGAGVFWIVEQQWKRNYIFNGTTPGTWWNGGHLVQC